MELLPNAIASGLDCGRCRKAKKESITIPKSVVK
jgi:hypothetical protein